MADFQGSAMDNVGAKALAFGVPELDPARHKRAYHWPPRNFPDVHWQPQENGWFHRSMPEENSEFETDSRWPLFFPSPLSIVTCGEGKYAAIEKVVGATIVNRFPYTLALSFCREPLSPRHYMRAEFMKALESHGRVTVQFLLPGAALDRVLSSISNVPDSEMPRRMAAASDTILTIPGCGGPVLPEAYLRYEGRLVAAARDFEGRPIYEQPFYDCGSHRIYFLEILRISLRSDIASGDNPLRWRSLPTLRATGSPQLLPSIDVLTTKRGGYSKTYRPDYVFPSSETVSFEGSLASDGFSHLEVPPLAQDQVEVDNERARWPCFFPSSLGLITAIGIDGAAAAFPCGSTSILSRKPLTVGICVSYARINARYAPRASLDVIRSSGRFGCGVPIYSPKILAAIAFLGSTSLRDEPDKAARCGLTRRTFGRSFGFEELPLHLDCRVVDEIRLGTHSLFLGEIEGVHVSNELSDGGTLEWCPWAGQASPASP